MQTARIIIIGGGIVGCSVLYHLARAGCRDALLIERAELTAGATWHAAGNVHNQNPIPNLSTLQAYSMQLYDGLAAEVGQAVGSHVVGGIFLAQSRARMQEFKFLAGKFKALGLPYELVTPADIQARFPLIDTAGLEGGAWDPDEGYVDPYSVAMGLAAGARKNGARILRNTRITAIRRTRSGHWRLSGDGGGGGDGVDGGDGGSGDGGLPRHPRSPHPRHPRSPLSGGDLEFECEIVVNAAGFWGNEVAQMVGGELPIVNMEHHYLVTESMPEIAAHIDGGGAAGELPLIRDLDAQFYLRQEGDGLLFGPWEKDCRPAWGGGGAPWDFGQELFSPDLERMEAELGAVYRRVPALGRAGIKRVVNGAISFTPDGRGLLGPLPGAPNFFVACGFVSGIAQGGGVGRALAEWLLEGETAMDLSFMDVARFGDWSTPAFARARVVATFPKRYEIAYPQLEQESGRSLKTTPIYARLQERGAVFGQAYGWERPLWFAADGGDGDGGDGGGDGDGADAPTAARDEPSFSAPNWWAQVGVEARAAHTAAALFEMSSYSKWEIAGPEAAAFLNRVVISRLPAAGRLALGLMLNRRGGIVGDLVLAGLPGGGFYAVGATLAEGIYQRWFEQQRGRLEVSIRVVTADFAALGVVGPAARALLSELSESGDADFSNAEFPFMTWRAARIGGIDCRALRLSYAGELGWELHCKMDAQVELFDALVAAGARHGLQLAGGRALSHLRLEKGYRSWGADLTAEVTPAAAGLARFCRPELPEKVDANGRAAALEAALNKAGAAGAAWPPKSLATLVFDAPTAAGCWGSEPVFRGDGDGADDGAGDAAGDDCVGYVTSGGYGWRIGRHLAVAWLATEVCAPGTALSIGILGERCQATVAADPVYDPSNAKLRS